MANDRSVTSNARSLKDPPVGMAGICIPDGDSGHDRSLSRARPATLPAMPPTSDRSRAEAVAWLVGRLSWERVLDDLRTRADGTVATHTAVETRRAA